MPIVLDRWDRRLQQNLRRRGHRASDVARDRTLVRRHSLRQVEEHLVDIAPAPALRRVITFDHRMAGGMEMGACMAVRRLVAAADMAADPAEPQVTPGRADLETFLASR